MVSWSYEGILIRVQSPDEITLKLSNGRMKKLLCSDNLWNVDPTKNKMIAKLINAGLNDNQPYMVKITVEDGIATRLEKIPKN